MKTAFAIDFLLKRTPEIFLLELLLAGHDDADIYTLAHAQGHILGSAERHRIIASPLSRFVQRPQDLRDKAWLIPSALKQIRVAPDVDRLVIISSGWAHAIESAPRTQRYTWLYSWETPETQLRGLKKLFAPYHQLTKKKALEQESHRSFASKTLALELGHPSDRVIAPGLKTDEFNFVSDEDHPGTYTHHLVILGDAPVSSVRQLISVAKQKGLNLRFIGDDSAYGAEKTQQGPELEFIGDHCEATTAALTHGARAVWYLGQTPFPAGALGALCCGRPAVVWDLPQNREFLGENGIWYLRQEGQIAGVMDEVEREFAKFDRKALRRQGLKWNERLFKTQMREFSGVVSVARPSALLS